MISEEMNKPKIKVMNLIYNMNDGGAEHIVLNYLRDFKNDPDIDFRLFVYKEAVTSECNDAIKAEGLPVTYLNNPLSRIKIPIIRGPFNRVVRRRAWRKAIHEFKPDIVHVHISELLTQTLWPIEQEKVPVRFDTLHSNPYRYKGLQLKYIKRAFNRSGFIPVCVTKAQVEEARDHYGITQYEIVRNGIDVNGILSRRMEKSEARRELNIPDSTKTVLGVGRLSPIKRFDLLIKAFAEALKKQPDMVLLLAGKGECEADLRKLTAELGIEDQVRFLGYRTDTELLYSAADVFCVTSETESSSIVLIEAQLFDTRCVISAGTPIENAITDKVCRMSRDASPADWAEAILDDGLVGEQKIQTSDIEVHSVSQRMKDIYIKHYEEYRNK